MRRAVVVLFICMLAFSLVSADVPDIQTEIAPRPQQSFLSDVVYNDTVTPAAGGKIYSGGGTVGEYTKTHELDMVDWGLVSVSGEYLNASVYMTVPNGCSGIKIALYAAASDLFDSDPDTYIRKDGGIWYDYGDLTRSVAAGTYYWLNFTSEDDSYWNSSYVEFGVYGMSSTLGNLIWDYAEATFYIEGETFTKYFVTPEQPTEDDSVTFTAITEPADAITSAYFNAVFSPSDFNDTNYQMDEDPENVFTYTFTSLTSGYYLFVLYLENSTTVKYVSYIPVRVIATGIDVDVRTFFGAGPDFTHMQIGGYINKQSNVSIHEWSDVDVYTETHTSSATPDVFNIAWAKLTTTASTVNYSLTFTNGSRSYTMNGSYAVAQTTFDAELSDKSETFDYVILEGEITKNANYIVYDASENIKATGTVTEGSFKIRFEKWAKASLSHQDYAVRFANGSQVDWLNGTFYADAYDAYKGGGVVTPDLWWQSPTFWFAMLIIGTIGSAVAIGMFKALGVGNLPNYGGGKR